MATARYEDSFTSGEQRRTEPDMVAMILYETTSDTTLFLMKTFPH
jgi:hypothetical protein